MASQRDLLGESDGDGEENDLAAINVNKSYAQRFAHNKQREALHRLQELKKKGYGGESDEDDDSEDEEEDEDGYIPEKTELQFYETLTKVKKKDPSIYQKEVQLYDDVDEEEEEKEAKESKKKALYLKDVMAQHLLEHGPEFADVEEKPKKRVTKSYAEEQDELKRAFLMEADVDDEDEDGENLLTVKKKSAEERRREKKEEEEAIMEAEQRAKDADVARKLEEYFGRDDDLDENEKFLKSYLLNKGWIDRDQGKGSGYEDFVGISEDEEEVEKQEKFEAEYNFRFEEGMGDQVLGYARFTEGSVRKKSNTRKQQRENKQERLAQAEFERKEELKHLKNIKKKEILEKLEKIKQIAGIKDDQGNLLGEEDLEEEFDPDEYDRKMREAFGDDYYGAEDVDENFEGYDLDDLEKPDFHAEDELLGLPSGWDGTQPQGFAAARESLKQIKTLENKDPTEDWDSESSGEEDVKEDHQKEEEDEDEKEGDDDDDQGNVMDVDDRDDDEIVIEGEEGTRKNKRRRRGRISLIEKLVFDKQLEEYYKLDYEDMIGDLPTRFKYREVPSNTYGLTAEEILETDDKELNQYVSIKKLAPYRTKEWKPLKHQWFSQKKRKRMALQQGGVSSFPNGTKKSESKSKGEKINLGRLNSHDQNHSKETNGELDSELKKIKKKHRRKQVPVFPKSRLAAYGMLIRDKNQH